jgi:hypothetical protein
MGKRRKSRVEVVYEYCRGLCNALPAAVVRIMIRFRKMDDLASLDSI